MVLVPGRIYILTCPAQNGLNKEPKMIYSYVEAPAIDFGAINHLFENLDLILANRRKIMFHRKYRTIKISGIFAGGLYVGMHRMTLGNLLHLWKHTEWHTGTRYYFNIIGTPLSGSNHSWWYDTATKKCDCGKYYNGKYHFLGLAKPALDYLKWHELYREPSKLTIFDLVKQLQRSK